MSIIVVSLKNRAVLLLLFSVVFLYLFFVELLFLTRVVILFLLTRIRVLCQLARKNTKSKCLSFVIGIYADDRLQFSGER